jgi:hypothetical protein
MKIETIWKSTDDWPILMQALIKKKYRKAALT